MDGSASIVVLGVVVLVVLAMLVVLVVSDRGATGGSLYDQIGQGGLSRESDAPDWASAAGEVGADSLVDRAEQEREVRQLLSARSERMVRKGQPALDVDAEVAKLLSEPHESQPRGRDAGLEREVRQLVMAKNERRVRQGLEPLDVEAEVARTLQELNP